MDTFAEEFAALLSKPWACDDGRSITIGGKPAFYIAICEEPVLRKRGINPVMAGTVARTQVMLPEMIVFIGMCAALDPDDPNAADTLGEMARQARAIEARLDQAINS
jgi:hypothetical protein